MTDQERISSRIAEIKSNMWDRLPPTYLPYGELVIDTNPEFLDSRTITFDIPSRSTDVIDESGDYGIRKIDTKWQIYYASTGDVIKESTSYSRFFDGVAWDDRIGTGLQGIQGIQGTEGTTLASSKSYPVTIHEVIDGTVRSAKDIAYKHPQIFNVKWSVSGDKYSSALHLRFTIRKDKELGPCLYQFSEGGFTSESSWIPPTLQQNPPFTGDPGISYTWTYETTFENPLISGTIVHFQINIDGKVTKLKTTYTPPGMRPRI